MNNYINLIGKFIKSLLSFRVRNEQAISLLKNRFLIPIVVRNDDRRGTSFRGACREISTFNNGFLNPNVVRNGGKKLLSSFLIKCKPYLLLLVCLCISSIAMAQTDPGSDPDVPIDGGLSLLIAAGAGYGVKQLRKKNNKSPK